MTRFRGVSGGKYSRSSRTTLVRASREDGVVDVLAYLRWEEDRMGLLTPLGVVLGDVLAG